MRRFFLRTELFAPLAMSLAAACGGAPVDVAPAAGETAGPAAKEGEGPAAAVQVEGLLGDIPRNEVERAFQRRNDAIAACYQEALDVSEQIEGSLEIALEIAADGSVTSAHLRNGTLGSARAESCILDLARRIVFPKPRGGSRAVVSYPLSLEKPYDDPAPADWTGDKADAAARSHAADVSRCLAGATGVQLTVYIGRGGAVISAGATCDSLEAAAGAGCLADAALSWTFPAPGPNGAKATLRF